MEVRQYGFQIHQRVIVKKKVGSRGSHDLEKLGGAKDKEKPL